MNLWLLISAAAAAPPPAKSFTAEIVTMLLSLVFVVALMLVTLWFVKRRLTGVPQGEAQVRVIQMIPVGTREKLVVLDDGKTRYIIGVTPNRISYIAPLSVDEPPSTHAASHTNLKQDYDKTVTQFKQDLTNNLNDSGS